MKKIAVFASGNGSNFQSVIDAIKAGKLAAEIGLVVCDKEEAFVLERAKAEQVEAFSFSPKNYPSKEAFEMEILEKLRERDIEFIVLAGYMRLIGPTLLQAYSHRMVNIHPSLLPAFPGKDAIGQAFQARVKLTGVTIHYVDEGMDTGPIIAQRAVPVLDDDTRETLQTRIQETEHEMYPAVLAELFQK
ncbi:phosphoribosylglycinamide formyltransferase [Peribacillus asahii]|uniref:Phosphoribosylglycinamide formyltransferase n=1 Tax=Peribacillus asahii TaxID=228899 RepID=A0A398B059_9BACI|nr:phosphoribosylglycinamide formyltransferase [Peribacillus asahii]RID82298.1 phosphoribosylglycinamide formyltransferase [Peribacillus asahii]